MSKNISKKISIFIVICLLLIGVSTKFGFTYANDYELIKNEVGENPILILDDVFSELDETRQKLLVDNLEDVQMFITTAEVAHQSIFNKENTTIFNIEKGKVISIQNGGN